MSHQSTDLETDAGGVCREAPSCRVFLSAPVQVCRQDDETVLQLEAVNLSTGGIFVRTGSPLAAGAPVELRFTLPGGAVIACCATVNRSVGARPGEAGMALTFQRLAPSMEAEIERFLSGIRQLQGSPARYLDAQVIFDEETDPVCEEEFACRLELLKR